MYKTVYTKLSYSLLSQCGVNWVYYPYSEYKHISNTYKSNGHLWKAMEIYDSIATLIWCFSSVTCASSSVLAFSAACLSKDAVSLRLCRIIPVREVGLITLQLTLAVKIRTGSLLNGCQLLNQVFFPGIQATFQRAEHLYQALVAFLAVLVCVWKERDKGRGLYHDS